MTVSEELHRLLELKERGVLTASEFDEQKARVLASDAPAPAKRSTRPPTAGSYIAIWIILAILGVGLLVGLATRHPAQAEGNGAASGDDTATGTEAVQAIAVTPQQLGKAYDDNEAAAQRDYGGRQLLVTGKVAGVDLDIIDNPIVLLDDPAHFLPVQASLIDDDKPEAANLHKGRPITLLCADVSEVVSVPMLKDCSIRTGANTTIKTGR